MSGDLVTRVLVLCSTNVMICYRIGGRERAKEREIERAREGTIRHQIGFRPRLFAYPFVHEAVARNGLRDQGVGCEVEGQLQQREAPYCVEEVHQKRFLVGYKTYDQEGERENGK